MTNTKYDFIKDVAKISSLEIFGIDACVSWEDLFKRHLCYDADSIEPCCPEESSVSTSEDIESYVTRYAESNPVYQYRLTVPARQFGDLGGRVDYIDENGEAQFKAWLNCTDNRNCNSFSFVFCAKYGSFTGSTTGPTGLGTVTHAFNEPCPDGAIQCFSDDGLERLSDCPN
jgi:hypothetical protein